MNDDEWRKRITNRKDLVARVTHLTRGSTPDEAFETLWKILTDKKIIGSGKAGYIIGDRTASCFQEVPLDAIAENLMYEEVLGGKIRYSAFGIRVHKGDIFSCGGRPVIYGNAAELKEILPTDQYWRIVSMNLTDFKHLIDWSHEREWRIPGDYPIEYNRIEVIVQSQDYYKKFVNRCIDKDRLDILKEINGIIALNSIYS